MAYCWGANDDGELGDGTMTNHTAPAVVSGGLTFISVTAGAVYRYTVIASDSADRCTFSLVDAPSGMTINAARALGLAHSIGSIAAGKQADLAVWRVESLAELGYWVGLPGPERRIFNGADS